MTLEEQQAQLLETTLHDIRTPERRGLDVSRILFDKPHFAAIAEALPDSNIRHLRIGREKVNDESVAPLLDILPRSKLETLHMNSGGSLHVATLEKLAEILPQTNITEIGFDTYYGQNPDAMNTFLDAVGKSKVTRFHVCGQDFGEAEADKLAALIKSGQLTEVVINRGRLQEEGTRKIVEALRGSNVEKFSLTHAKMDDANMQLLAEILPDSRIHDLRLWSCDITAQGAASLAEGLQGSGVETLNIGSNHRIGPQGTIALAQALSQTDIHTLAIDQCSSKREGFAALFDALPDCGVQSLQLFSSQMDSTDATHLAEVLPRSQLRNLSLSWNHIGNRGAEKLADALPDSHLTYLSLGDCSIGDDGAKAIAGALPASALGYLDMRGDEFTESGMQALADAIPDSRLTRIECYGSKENKALQEAASTCIKEAHKHKTRAFALARKVIGEPQSLQPDDWQEALDHLGGLRFCIDQEWKTDDFFPIESQETDYLLANSFLGAAAHGVPAIGTKAILQLVPYHEAKEALQSIGVTLRAADFLQPDGSMPQKSICQAGNSMLMNDSSVWDDAAQFRTAYESLSDACKQDCHAVHIIPLEINRRNADTTRGR